MFCYSTSSLRSVDGVEVHLFELVDDAGDPYEEWAPDDANKWRRRLADTDELQALIAGEWIEFADRWVTLRVRGRHELIPDRWFDLLRLLYREEDFRDVRFSFYWHH